MANHRDHDREMVAPPWLDTTREDEKRFCPLLMNLQFYATILHEIWERQHRMDRERQRLTDRKQEPHVSTDVFNDKRTCCENHHLEGALQRKQRVSLRHLKRLKSRGETAVESDGS